MSHYHRVRPNKNKHKHQNQVSQPAAPAQPPMPTVAQMEQVAIDRLEKATAFVYKERHGDTLDASINRCKRLLEVYDREQDQVLAAEIKGGYRWTISPAIMFRIQKELPKLEEQRDTLRFECRQEAKEIVAQWMHEQSARIAAANPPKDDSLCPPKQTPATQADAGAMLASPAASAGPSTAEGAQANAAPIAA